MPICPNTTDFCLMEGDIFMLKNFTFLKKKFSEHMKTTKTFLDA